MASHGSIDGPLDKAERLRTINATMEALCPCALRSHARAVPGCGNPDADILFIGEAPGQREDETGVPFVGAAGKFLDTLLASINLKREDIYITNIVKYRPPNNRDPLPQEIADCWPWLQEQITVIDPLLIVPLGRHALTHFIPGRKISEDHGRAFRRAVPGCGTRVFYALYHPAAALYNGALRETLLQDFSRIPQLMRKLRASR